MREIALGVVLVVAAALVIIGVSGWSVHAGRVVAGVLTALLGWLFLADDGADEASG